MTCERRNMTNFLCITTLPQRKKSLSKKGDFLKSGTENDCSSNQATFAAKIGHRGHCCKQVQYAVKNVIPVVQHSELHWTCQHPFSRPVRCTRNWHHQPGKCRIDVSYRARKNKGPCLDPGLRKGFMPSTTDQNARMARLYRC